MGRAFQCVCADYVARWTHAPRRSTSCVLVWVGKWPGCIVLPKGKGQGIHLGVGVKFAPFQ